VKEHAFVFPERWRDLRGRAVEDAEARSRLDGELDREVAPGHVLHGRRHEALAACSHCDDVIFTVNEVGYAVVHLSFPGDGPDRPPWPDTDLLESWAEVEKYVLDHDEW
jgi:hypothetical protein